MEPGNPLLDRYVLSLAPARRPRVLFVGTASGENPDYEERFREAFRALGARPKVLSLFRPPRGSLRDSVLRNDVVYVGGGNTRSMLALWREWGLDRILREAWKNGVVLTGVSAGMICWFREGLTDSATGTLGPLRCLGFLPGSACPHYDGEQERRPIYRRLVRTGVLAPGLAADDGVALHYLGRRLHRVVSSRRKARGWRVERSGTRSREVPLESEYLGVVGGLKRARSR